MKYKTKEGKRQEYLTIREQLIREEANIPSGQWTNVIELRKWEEGFLKAGRNGFLEFLNEQNSKPNSLFEANTFLMIANGRIAQNNWGSLGGTKMEILEKDSKAVILVHELGKKLDFTLSEKLLPPRIQWYEMFGESRKEGRVNIKLDVEIEPKETF